MEPAQRISEEWSSLSGFYMAEEADFMRQLLGNCSFPEEITNDGNSNLGISSVFWPAYDDSTVVSLTGVNDNCSPNVPNANLFCFSQGSSSSREDNIIGSIPPSFCLEDANISPYGIVQGTEHLSQQINDNNDGLFGAEPGKEVLGDENMQVDSEFEMPVSEPIYTGKSGKPKNSAKRSRSSIEAPKTKRNVKSKNSKSASVKEEERSPGLQAQSVSGCSSEDDSNAYQDGGASSCLSPQDPKSVGESRSIKGPATDPQSIYARKRRERINERLRILQKLVPNGTKVDISTMLDEAVQYVKFLQLQIKLLSSDDLWMYAPIAYNGMNIGLDLNITSTKRP